ncbi:type II secretion system F family protein [uncultured Amnibacterium sp.]|uniref:type II secretion system F family protein n=1 Tax=uncultured Amnibacterium sp. TaxID=1631851 RepID=UPI0035C9845F
MTTSTVRSFAYRARDTTGKVTKGRVDAVTEAAAVARMRGMGLAPLQVVEARENSGLNREITLGFLRQRVGLKDLTIMSRQMATLVSSGLSLLRTLDILSEQTDSAPLTTTLVRVRTDVESGSSISDAFARHPDVFPSIMVNMVRAGETGGFLDKALASVALTFEKDVKLRSTIKSAMTYPVVVLVIAVVAVIGMMVFVVPIFQKMFAGLGGTLPLPTLILIWLSQAMVWVVPALIVVFVLAAFWWRRNRRKEAVRSRFDRLRLRIPVFGPLLAKIAIARFARNFASMVGSGVPVLRSLAIVGETSGSWVIEHALQSVQDSVRAGNSIAAPLRKEPVFPPMVVQMIAVGEDSGALEPMLNRVADFYDDEVQATTEALTSLIEPLLIVVIGVVIGGMIIALYLPIFNIYSLLK